MTWLDAIKLFIVVCPTILLFVPMLYMFNWMKSDISETKKLLTNTMNVLNVNTQATENRLRVLEKSPNP